MSGFQTDFRNFKNTAARVTVNFSNDIPGPEVLNAFQWKNHAAREDKTKAKTMYTVLNELAMILLEKLFEHKRNVIQYNLGGSFTSLQPPLPKTEKFFL